MVWSLASLGLVDGDQITYHAEAIDAFDLPRPAQQPPGEGLSEEAAEIGDLSHPLAGIGQVGISAYRRIDVISSDQKRRELASRQAGVLDSLQELQDRQSRLLESTAGLRIQSELAERLQEEDIDLLKQTELEQQQVREQLDGSPSAALAQVQEIEQELASNQIDDLEMAQQLGQLGDELSALADELLPGVEQSLARARKLSQTSKSSAGEARGQLQQAEQGQTEALARMSELNSQLGRWRKQFEVTSEVDDLIAAQTDLKRQTIAIGRETLTKRPGSLTSQQEADLARLSDRQRRLAARLEELLKTADTQSEPDPPAPRDQAVQEALRQLAEGDTASQMHSAAESLRRNEIASTTDAQQQALDDLRKLDEQLQGTGSDAAESLLSSVEEQREQVETLRKRQSELATDAAQALQSDTARTDPDQLQRLIKQQEELARQADDLARDLRRQQQRQSGQSAARAARRMREAQQSIEQQQPQATSQAQQDALDDLTQLAGELAERQQQIERELARQQIEQLANELQDLADQQQKLIERTVDLDERQRTRGSWSRSLRRELRELTDEQNGLADRLGELQNQQGDYPVIELTLRQATEAMRSAASLLTSSQSGSKTVEFQRRAHKRLLALVEALEQSPAATDRSAATPPPAGEQQPGQQSQPAAQLLGPQLRLLRSLQADVRQRTADLTSEAEDRDADADAITAQRESLARDQKRIAELARKLLQQFAENAVGAPGEEAP